MSSPTSPDDSRGSAPSDFIRDMVAKDVAAGKHGGAVVTRFPPEPNGYLHIGHAKSICLNFGLAREYSGRCHLRYDDTNPTTEDPEFVAAIQSDVRWLGFDWGEHLYYASDYFERFYQLALELVRQGKAYVDDSSEEEIRRDRGTVTEPGRESPCRNRTIAESLTLLERMRAGELPDGSHVLRAKIDLSSPNMKMRDPLLYRIRHAAHYRTGDAWPIYPMYDWAHPLSDAFEGITHSLCTLEFENNRELYDWVVRETGVEHRPEQTEFARLNLSYTVLSKRKLAELVEKGCVEGWDDPRMPTLSGLRRRGFTPEAIRAFCEAIGVAKANATIDVALLEHSQRDDLNLKAPRLLGVLRPLEVVLENYPEGRSETFDAPLYPRDVPREGSRPLPFGRVLYIERDDFCADPPKGFHRLAPGREVRLRHAYVIRCDEVVENDAGEVVQLRCSYDPESLAGTPGRKIAGTIHWVSAAHALETEVRLYDRLFTQEKPDSLDQLNPGSLEVLRGYKLEPGLADIEPGSRVQLERQGYFYLEPENTSTGRRVLNRIVALRDTWAKLSAESPAPTPSLPVAPAPATEDARRRRKRSKADAEPRAQGAEQSARFERYLALGLSEHEAGVLGADAALAAFFDAALAAHPKPRAVANWVVHELLRELKDRPLAELPFGAAELAALVAMVDVGEVSAAAGREVLAEMLTTGKQPATIVAVRGLGQLGAEDLRALVDAVLAGDGENVALYRAGKTALLGHFIGQVMKRTAGRADPKSTRELLLEKLGG